MIHAVETLPLSRDGAATNDAQLSRIPCVGQAFPSELVMACPTCKHGVTIILVDDP